MKRLPTTATAMLLMACSTSLEQRQNAAMERIEQKVKLPPDALPLNGYARYYALDGNTIIGTYIAFTDPKNAYYDLPIGQRRWVDDYRNLPGISGGGCAVVDVIYDNASEEVRRVLCNGDA